MRVEAKLFQKIAFVHAMAATEDGVLETVLDGVTETNKAYKKGDYIVEGASLHERYTMAANKFLKLYDVANAEDARTDKLANEGFMWYRPKGMIWGHQLTEHEAKTHFPTGSFQASWGEMMLVDPGDFLSMPFPEAAEIYRIQAKAFATSYGPISEDEAHERIRQQATAIRKARENRT